jgi:hypothetical protein
MVLSVQKVPRRLIFLSHKYRVAYRQSESLRPLSYLHSGDNGVLTILENLRGRLHCSETSIPVFRRSVYLFDVHGNYLTPLGPAGWRDNHKEKNALLGFA